jgi:hypothetical protein
MSRRGPDPPAPLDDGVAATGVAELDNAIGGLFWGDNVVFEVAAGAAAAPFYRAIAASEVAYERRLFVQLEEGSLNYGGFEVIDARPRSKLAQPAPLLRAVFERCQGTERNLLLFEGLEAMVARWGAEVAARFFARCCPQLLELGAIAYWSMPGSEGYVALRRTVQEITQCLFVLDKARLRVAKAEGRPLGVEGSVFRYSARRAWSEASASQISRGSQAYRQVRSRRPSADSAASPSRRCSSCPHSST